MKEGYISVPEAARELGYTVQMVRKYIEWGLLDAEFDFPTGAIQRRNWRIPEQELARLKKMTALQKRKIMKETAQKRRLRKLPLWKHK